VFTGACSGANLLAAEKPGAKLKRRNYPEAAIGSILRGDLQRILR